MKLASFAVSGRPSYGIVTPVGVVDLGKRIGDRAATLKDALKQIFLAELQELADKHHADWSLDEVRLEIPIPNPDKIICVGRNYGAHLAEAGMEIPRVPNLFARYLNSLVAPGEAILRPTVSNEFDYEGELAIVIGKRGRNISKNAALSHIAGYACFNDGCIRDYQFNHSLLVGKNFESTGSFGPWIVTSDEIPDPSSLTLTTRLNENEVQKSGIDKMLFDVPTLIAYISAFTTLEVGDVIATGTPEGVGFTRKPPRMLQPGDVVEVKISNIGTLRNRVANGDADATKKLT